MNTRIQAAIGNVEFFNAKLEAKLDAGMFCHRRKMGLELSRKLRTSTRKASSSGGMAVSSSVSIMRRSGADAAPCAGAEAHYPGAP